MTTTPKWIEAVAKADAHKALGQHEVWLGYPETEFPWAYASDLKEGGSHRFDMDTSVTFYAEHPCGLTFRWSFDLEPISAAGKSTYEIDTAGVAKVLTLVPPAVAEKLRVYLRLCAGKVREQANGYLSSARNLYGDAAVLDGLAALSESEG